MNWNVADEIKPEDYKSVLVCEYFADWAPAYKEAFYSSERGKWYDKDGDDDFGDVRYWCELPDTTKVDREKELAQLLEDYGMEEICEGYGYTSFVWYKGSDIKKEGLETWSAEGRGDVVLSVIKELKAHPEWKKS